MCRSIRTLRPPALPEGATEDDIAAAALQYVRKVSGFREPAAHNREVFERAVAEVADATRRLLDGLRVRGAAVREPVPGRAPDGAGRTPRRPPPGTGRAPTPPR
ncbi:DUF2277 domain-containing protein [Streptomyces sudanensis]|uniref:DUF2277 domain-containing protein n=1 Tax=Streptomyces sudanensis TaxID=436397 RepID=A0ABY4TAG5_9ACTN|nr:MULTISPECIES: DUF2277 domain-containing protein [Streptomyces]MCP9959160.1 DUF2277 domain-containing protein [Streptomyces sudanensis]MCP9988243.1 DUF2277 domain-containing protein [Streptomyces sudanensis]MCQ0000380.1 DUF2277 domain-containing protein [Streptomyces sudanensis]URN15939.1 DUF2277 domain-containing protein [Streptomyces sudanensis]